MSVVQFIQAASSGVIALIAVAAFVRQVRKDKKRSPEEE